MRIEDELGQQRQLCGACCVQTPGRELNADGSVVDSGTVAVMKKLLLLLIVLLVYLQYQLWFGDGSLQEFWELHQEVEMQARENLELRERNAALQAEVADLRQGLDAIEEHAREDLGMVKEGETFYQVVE